MTLKKTRISAVIPTFMEEQYIATLLSQIAKTEPPVEIVVVDSLSQDKTTEIAKRFTNKVYQIRERGIARAKNYGAKKANGNILIFIDADVQPNTDFVTKVLRTFNDVRVVGATCNVMPSQGKLNEIIFSKFYNSLIRVVSRFKPHSQGKFFAVRRESFFRVNGFNQNLPCLEDHDLAFRLSNLGKIVFVRDLTVYESPRRFRKRGLLRAVMTWFLDYVAFVVRGKPISKTYSAMR
jgi:glycosyltransferase involved in cell wall biosynthesis